MKNMKHCLSNLEKNSKVGFKNLEGKIDTIYKDIAIKVKAEVKKKLRKFKKASKWN